MPLISLHIPPMRGIDRRAVSVRAGHYASPFKGLLVPVVAGLAQGLSISPVKEQLLPALVRLDVVNDGGGYDAAESLAHAAQRLGA
jgi:hypothetical protein